MNKPLALLLVITIAIVGAGCKRDATQATPDRAGHATGTAGKPDQRTPGEGETYYTLKDGDTLTSVAKNHGTTVDELIRRNKVTHDVRPGTRLVVPDPAAKKQ